MKTIITFLCLLSIGSQVSIAESTSKTADEQMKGTPQDVETTRKIRERLNEMEGLSMRAKNVTIVTEGKNVSLRGEVDKQDEVKKVMNVANEMAPGRTISNQLKVHK